MTHLKNYGVRTCINNWFEERVTMNAYWGRENQPLALRDLTVDDHVPVREENPRMVLDAPFQKYTTYSYATAPEWLETRGVIRRHGETTESRKRLDGTAALRGIVLPGSSLTRSLCSHEFQDPLKFRCKTSYEKHYGRPEFEAIRGKSRRDESYKPKRTALTSTWDPTWGS
jgi:hypothetical protein